jgi:cytochrome d ubiquinol oxidase subunit II
MELALTWLCIIAFVIIMYIVLDGFTLGVGLLLPFISGEKERSIMLATVLPVWDGNETWLVFAGAALYGAFPLSFSTLFPLWYIPLMILVFGLLLRGISFEFRLKAHKTRQIWDWSLFTGSFMVVIAQGLIVASFVSGINSSAPHNMWFSWFGGFCAFALVIAYSLLGSARLIKKTNLQLQNKFYSISGKLQWVLMLTIVVVGIYSPQSSKLHLRYWFDLQSLPWLVIFLVIMLGLFAMHALAIKKRFEQLPFISLIIIFIIAYLALITSNLPYLVPNQITFMQAKADDGALLFMLVGAVILIPLLLFYTAYAYRIFGGKTNEKISY